MGEIAYAGFVMDINRILNAALYLKCLPYNIIPSPKPCLSHSKTMLVLIALF